METLENPKTSDVQVSHLPRAQQFWGVGKFIEAFYPLSIVPLIALYYHFIRVWASEFTYAKLFS